MNKQGISIFIVTGRTGHSLVVAKATPFAELDNVKKIYIFSESRGFDIHKCHYIEIPGWIKKIKPSFLAKAFRIFFEPAQLLYYTIRIKPDFINGVYCLPKGLNSYIVSRLTRTKCVNSIIGSVLEIESEMKFFRKFWERVNLWHLRGCEAVTVKGETDKQFLVSKGLDREKMFQLNGSIDTDRFSYTDSFRKIDLLFVGTFYEIKGPDRILKIIEKLLQEFPGLKAVMVGTGSMFGQIQSMSADMGLENNISLEGYQSDPVKYFMESKILIMPSRSDSLPTSMLEAMSCGCVPVISNVGNVKEAAHNKVNSILVENYSDIDGFAAAITDLLKDDETRKEYAFKARKMVEENYSVKSQSKIAADIIRFLNIN